MLYGYCETVDAKIATIVSAADTIEEYNRWIELLGNQSPRTNFIEFTATKLIDHLTRIEFKGYKQPVIVAFHETLDQRSAFVTEWDILLVQTEPARDLQKDMIHLKKIADENARRDTLRAEVEAKGEKYRDLTLEERLGIVDHDPWDKRSDAQKASDDKLKKRMKELQEKGEITEDSFGGADQQRKARTEKRAAEQASNNDETASEIKTDKGVVVITDIRVKTDAAGNVQINNVLAHKQGGEADTELAAERAAEHQRNVDARKKGRRSFDPEDFAAVLRGDGSSDVFNIPTDPSANARKRQPGNPEPDLTPHAQQARKEYKDNLKKQQEVNEVRQRAEDDITAKEEHSKGIFRGTDLIGDQTINVVDLPDKFVELLKKNKISAQQFPLKDYPYNSLIGEHILLPTAESLDEKNVYLMEIDNLHIEGTISVGTSKVFVAKKISEQLGWAIYGRALANAATTKKKTADPTDAFTASVVRIR